MKLIDLVKSRNRLKEELIIFIEDKDNFNSNIILSEAEDGDEGIKIEQGKRYYYLIEVFLAKEFIEDWIQSLNYRPTKIDIAKRLFEYAINDA